MRAALLTAMREPMVLEDVALHPPTEGRVLVRAAATPFCSTDCISWRGDLVEVPPVILGHASVGEIVEVGPGVAHLRIGQRVIVPGTPECGVCFYCSIGRPDQCAELFDTGGWRHVADRADGQAVTASGNVGGYAEIMNVGAFHVVPTVSDLPDDWLCLLGCGIGTGLGCVFNIAQVQPGASVAIVGLGHLGQWMVQAARVAGARRIIGVDPIAARREVAAAVGATDLVDPAEGDAIAQVQALTEGRGADVVLDAGGTTAAMVDAVNMSRRAGTVVLTTVVDVVSELTIHHLALTITSRTIHGAQNGRMRIRRDIPRFIRMLEDGVIDPVPIITGRYALGEINDALAAATDKRDLTGVVLPGR